MHGRLKVKTTAQQEEEKKKVREEKREKYVAAWTILNLKRKQSIYDNEALAICAQLLLANPDALSLWNYRREIVEQSRRTLDEKAAIEGLEESELRVTEDCLQKNHKSYGAWHHRQWILQTSVKKRWDEELDICDHYLKVDERNFHCWDHRRFVAKHSSRSTKEELDYTQDLIGTNFSNYSAWHYRLKLLPLVYPPGKDCPYRIKEGIFLEELKRVTNAIFTDPADQSPWFFLQWLLSMDTDKEPTVVGSGIVDIHDSVYFVVIFDRPMASVKSYSKHSTVNNIKEYFSESPTATELLKHECNSSVVVSDLGNMNIENSGQGKISVEDKAYTIFIDGICDRKLKWEPGESKCFWKTELHLSEATNGITVRFSEDSKGSIYLRKEVEVDYAGVEDDTGCQKERESIIINSDKPVDLKRNRPPLSNIWLSDEVDFCSKPSSDVELVLEEVKENCVLLEQIDNGNKWVMLALVNLMWSLNKLGYCQLIIDTLERLKKIDPLRTSFYCDTISKLQMELNLVSYLKGDWQSFSIHCNLTRLVHAEYLAFASKVDLSNNALRCLEPVGYIVSCQELILDGNPLEGLDPIVRLPRLNVLSVAGCKMKAFKLFECLRNCKSLLKLDMRDNLEEESSGSVEQLLFHIPEVIWKQ